MEGFLSRQSQPEASSAGDDENGGPDESDAPTDCEDSDGILNEDEGYGGDAVAVAGEENAKTSAQAFDEKEDVQPMYCSLQYGFILRYTYEHSNRLGEMLGVCYNSRYRKFLIIDHKGVTSWLFEALSGQTSSRLVNYPKYKYRLYSNVLYTRKHNVYFALGRDFSLKILNSNFEETYTVDANLRNVMFLLFNPLTDELITGGVGGTKVWSFAQVVETKGWKALRAMANYKLMHKYTLQNVGGGWVKKVELDHALQRLYCCSETDLYAYDLDGNELFAYRNAHDMSITSCVFSTFAQLLVTSSMDCTVKCWSAQGGLTHTFRGHSKAVTQLLVHPDSAALILSSSMDASIRIWSLHTMECVYSITVSLSGIQWMGLTDDNLLYTCTDRQLALWNLNHFTHFFGLTRSNAIRLSQHPLQSKVSRTLVVSEDSCIRLFSQAGSGGPAERRSTVLPMPCISPSERLLGLAYSRQLNLVYCLVTPAKLWMYTARTDPACRIAHWNLAKIQGQLLAEQFESEARQKKRGQSSSGGMLPLWLKKLAAANRALQAIHPGSTVSPCRCICMLSSPVTMWSKDGQCSPRSQNFLLLGLEDGRIMFIDPFVRGRRHMDFKANKDPITEIRHDEANCNLLTKVNGAGITTIQIWSLPDLDLLHELEVFKNLVNYSRMESVLFCGYGDGSVSFQSVAYSGNDSQRIPYGQVKNEDDLIGANLVQKRYEHQAAIVAVDSCLPKSIFMSCSADGIIKIWSAKTHVPLADITMNGPVSTAGFLGRSGDIILGFQNNLFYVLLRKACPLAAAEGLTYSEAHGSLSTLADSDVYEDVAIRYEGVLSSAAPLTLRTYLKPYDLAFTKEFVDGTTVIKTELPADDASSAASGEGSVSAASTQVYMSPFITPGVSTIELAYAHDIDEISPLDHRDLKQIAFDMLDVTNPKLAKHYLPMFGQSPGGTPTVSSPSEPSTPGGVSLSEGEDELEGVDVESRPAFAARPPALPPPKGSSQRSQSAQMSKAGGGSSSLTTTFSSADDQPPRKSILDGIRITLDRSTTPPATMRSRFALEGSMKIESRPPVKVTAKRPEEKVEKRSMQVRPQVKKKRATDARKRPRAGNVKGFEDDDTDADAPQPAKPKEPREAPSKPHGEGRADASIVARSKGELIALAPSTDFRNDLKMPQPSKGAPKQQQQPPASAVYASSQKKRPNVISQHPPAGVKPGTADPKVTGEVIDISQHLNESSNQADTEALTALIGAAQRARRLPPPRERFRRSPSTEQPAASPEMVGGELNVGHADDDLADGQRGKAVRLPLLPGGDALDELNRWVALAGIDESQTSSAIPGERADTSGRPSRNSDVKASGTQHMSRVGGSRSQSLVFARLARSQAGSQKSRTSATKDVSPRPWTSPPEPAYVSADLLQAFEDALLRFQGDKDVIKLLKFAGIAFDDHWHEKIIERHRLLLMQKDLRTQSAASNRRLLSEKRNERLRLHLGVPIDEEGVAAAESGASADAFLRLLMKLGGGIPAAYAAATGSSSSWPDSAASTTSRLQRWPDSVLSRSESVPSGSATTAESKARRVAESSTQYRYRIKSSDVQSRLAAGGTAKSVASTSADRGVTGAMDARTVDPRNPQALRPHSSRSIPSKCSRYILVKRHQEGGADAVVANSLEAQLLRQRFPGYADRVLRESSPKKPTAASRPMTTANEPVTAVA